MRTSLLVSVLGALSRALSQGTCIHVSVRTKVLRVLAEISASWYVGMSILPACNSADTRFQIQKPGMTL